ncbi:MAG: ATP-binding protein [Acidobacteria bacterium]|nr:ATP-binding protein [Acidobacteriota bacterium]MCA1627134.1 ATP-binding protein [Acidobacteriota bacterium]
MQDFEKLGAFYLGRPFDLDEKKPKAGLLLYDSKDLVTHAVCVGMTGSGKTGLCITLLEEAAIDSIPAIIIDPKGDLSNLLLTFPNLAPEDFAPWLNEGEDAAQKAQLWKDGLESWGQDGERIRRLRDAAEFRVYTPGSNAGLPVSILKSFDAPNETIRQDNELLGERINTTVTSLLGLIGVTADPLRSREHILLSNILHHEWSNGRNFDIAGLIQQIQTPPMTKIGVMELDTFFPAGDRMELAMALNHLLASPSFASWMEGEPLDIQSLLYTPQGKPRLSIFSIAHLADAERMFFVSLLLNQVLGWVRAQSGTTSLRAILYMDEIFGYFPPVANPPSKLPLLTLLKQGRAFGLGVVLATQNPVDLDYKGLANTGTWFIGRLQTERDKARVLEGLEGIAAGSGQKFDKQEMEETLAGLSTRIFVLNNVHDDAPVVFETRWAMSYLRGPLTRSQIKLLMDPLKSETAAQPTLTPLSPVPLTVRPSAPRTQLPPDITQYYIPVRSSQDANLVYQPMLLGLAEIHYSKSKTIDVTQQVTLVATINDGPIDLDWNAAMPIDLPAEDLETEPQPNAQFTEVPAKATKVKSYGTWRKDFASWLYRNQRLELLESPSLDVASSPGESERDFRVRLQQIAREQRDEAVEKLRQKYAARFAQLEERKRRAEQAVAREAEEAKDQKFQTAISFGATLLSSFMGRKRTSMSTLGRATTAVRGVSRTRRQADDVDRAEDNVAAVTQRFADLEAEFKAEVETIDRSFDPQTEQLGTVSLKPTKANINVKLLTLVWAPYRQNVQGEAKPAWE